MTKKMIKEYWRKHKTDKLVGISIYNGKKQATCIAIEGDITVWQYVLVFENGVISDAPELLGLMTCI